MSEVKSPESSENAPIWAKKFRPLKKYNYEVRPTPFATDRSESSYPPTLSSVSPFAYKVQDSITASQGHTHIRVFPSQKNIESTSEPFSHAQRRQFPDRVNARSGEDVWTLPPQKRTYFPKNEGAAGELPRTDIVRGKKRTTQNSTGIGGQVVAPYATHESHSRETPSSSKATVSRFQNSGRGKALASNSIVAQNGFLTGSDAQSQKEDMILERRRRADAMKREPAGAHAIKAMTSSISSVLSESRLACEKLRPTSNSTNFLQSQARGGSTPSNKTLKSLPQTKTEAAVKTLKSNENTRSSSQSNVGAGVSVEDDRKLVQNLPSY